MKIVALDVGTKRIGVAYADAKIKIPIPAPMIEADGNQYYKIALFAKQHQTNFFVIGLPRNNSGLETRQTAYTRRFAQRLLNEIPGAKIRFQDESFTSVEASERLKNHPLTLKSKLDSESATIILQDFLENLGSNFNLSQASVHSSKSSRQASTINALTTKNNTSLSQVENKELTLRSQQNWQLSKKKSADLFLSPIEPTKLKLIPKTKKTLAKIAKKSTSNNEIITSNQKEHMKKTRTKPSKKLLIFSLLFIFIFLPAVSLLTFWYFLAPLSAVQDLKKFTIKPNSSISQIASDLESQKIIKSSFFFGLYAKFIQRESKIQAGTHQLSPSWSAYDVLREITKPAKSDNTFRFTIKPGETLRIIKSNLEKVGYDRKEIDQAFDNPPDHPILKYKPKDASLEGYLFGETHEFYKTAKVEIVIKKFLDSLQQKLEQHNLETEFKAQGLSVHQAIILASVVQKEAAPKDQPGVAQVFFKRLKNNDLLGSDVTASYAADLVDPERKIYTDNEKVLKIESCYNTRKTTKGLPCGAISSPSLSALRAVASPADTNYYYFLTGDDEKMYYSHTLSEHQQKTVKYCKKRCNVKL